MLSDYEDVILPLMEENARLKREVVKQMETISQYMNKNNSLWLICQQGGLLEKAREV